MHEKYNSNINHKPACIWVRTYQSAMYSHVWHDKTDVDLIHVGQLPHVCANIWSFGLFGVLKRSWEKAHSPCPYYPKRCPWLQFLARWPTLSLFAMRLPTALLRTNINMHGGPISIMHPYDMPRGHAHLLCHVSSRNLSYSYIIIRTIYIASLN